MNDTALHDPYRRRIATPAALDRLVAFAAITWGGSYLGWRLTDSLFDVPLLLGIPLVIAELVVWLSFGSFLHRNWRRPRPVEQSTATDLGNVDIFVTSLNDPIDAVRATLIGCHALAGSHSVWVLDDGNRREIADVAAEHGAEYVARTDTDGARAGNVNHAMHLTDADHVLLLSAGDVPLPDIFTHLAPALAEASVGAVVAGTVERDADRAAPRLVELAEREIGGPSLDQVDAAPWSGGPVLVRRRAHHDVGGLPTDTVAPEIGFSVRLWTKGWSVRTVPLTLAETPGPANLTARLALRDRHVHGRIELLRTSGSHAGWRGLTGHQRFGRLGVVAVAGASLARLVMAAVGVCVLLTGVLPLSIAPAHVAALFLPAIGLRALTTWLLSDGRLRPFATVQHELSYLGLHLRALGRAVSGRRASYRFAPRRGRDPKARDMIAKVPVLATTALLLAAGVVFRIGLVVTGHNDLSGLATATLLALGASAALLVSFETARWAHRRERRNYGRLPVEVSGRIDGSIVRVLDVVSDGMGIETGEPTRLGSTVRISLHLPDPTGALHDLRLTGKVRWVSDVGDGIHRAGLEFVGLSAIERDRLVEFASVTVPFRRVSRPLTADAVRGIA